MYNYHNTYVGFKHCIIMLMIDIMLYIPLSSFALAVVSRVEYLIQTCNAFTRVYIQYKSLCIRALGSLERALEFLKRITEIVFKLP